MIKIKKIYGVERLVFSDAHIELDQSANILTSFPALFKRLYSEGTFVERIIEIGSSRGGLLPTLKEISMLDFDAYSYDIRIPLILDIDPDLVKKIGIKFIVKDCFEVESEIAKIIQEKGLTILLCDGGNKVKEFNTFAKHLKQNDIIMVHDYGETREKYKTNIADKNIWKMEWLSSSGDQIEETCQNEGLYPFMQEEFITSVWGIRRKK